MSGGAQATARDYCCLQLGRKGNSAGQLPESVSAVVDAVERPQMSLSSQPAILRLSLMEVTSCKCSGADADAFGEQEVLRLPRRRSSSARSLRTRRREADVYGHSEAPNTPHPTDVSQVRSDDGRSVGAVVRLCDTTRRGMDGVASMTRRFRGRQWQWRCLNFSRRHLANIRVVPERQHW